MRYDWQVAHIGLNHETEVVADVRFEGLAFGTRVAVELNLVFLKEG